MKLTDDQKWQALVESADEFDGRFYYGVLTTGVYCKPSCRSRIPLRKNVRFYNNTDAAKADGLRPCKRCQPDITYNPEADLMYDIARYIAGQADKKLNLNQLGLQAHMSAGHLQKTFKKVMGLTPKQYHDACRQYIFKKGLRDTDSIITAIQQAGYSSASRVYEKLSSNLGMIPKHYRHGGENETISYATANTELGPVLIAATDIGICFLQFADSESHLIEQLKKEYPKAKLELMPKNSQRNFKQWIKQLDYYLAGKIVSLNLPLDIRGTAFQKIVWDYLQTIPRGDVQSYTEVATALGKPKGARAVASACGKNSIAIAIPCHRVIRGNGELAGYRWGLARKRSLIDLERNLAGNTGE